MCELGCCWVIDEVFASRMMDSKVLPEGKDMRLELCMARSTLGVGSAERLGVSMLL